MDAGAGAAGRSSYATGGRGWEIKNGNEATSNRVWVTRRIRCPVGRRSRGGVGFCESEDSYERGLGKSRLRAGAG